MAGSGVFEKAQTYGDVHEYVKEFSSLMLDIKNMSKEDNCLTLCPDYKVGHRSS